MPRIKVTRKKVIIAALIVLALIPFVIYIVNAVKPEKKPEEKYFSIQNQEYYPDELIVKFVQGYEPDKLSQKVHEREIYSQNALGKIIIARQNTKNTLIAQPSPEKRWEEVQQMFDTEQVIGYHPIVQNDENLSGYYVLQFPQGTNLEQKQKALSNYKSINFIEPNNVVHIFQAAAPNDQYYPDMWGLKMIDAEAAWQETTGSDSVTVAVVDTGADASHTDLGSHILSGGHDFWNSDNNPDDDMGHGTHVSGTIGALTNNGVGVSGINWNVSILPVKICGSQGSCSKVTIAQGIEYAVENGADIINLSVGATVSCVNSPLIENAVKKAIDSNIVVVAAAGNAIPKNNISAQSSSKMSPASCEEVISVGAVGPDKKRASYSFWDSTIAAPGGTGLSDNSGILSTFPGNSYKVDVGTSMAAPHVSGAAALLLSLDPTLTPSEIKNCLVQGAVPISTDHPIGPLLNIKGAIDACNLHTDNKNNNSSADPKQNPQANSGEYSAEGIVFQDIDNNGKKDTNEQSVQGISVILSSADSTLVAETDSNGTFSFPNLALGKYVLTLNFNNSRIAERQFTISDTIPHWFFNIPTSNIQTNPQQPNEPQGQIPQPPPEDLEKLQATSVPIGTATPTPTPIVFYSCKEVKDTRTINNKQVSLTRLDCAQIN